MIDSFGREITYLRLSVTDRCNLRCVYCMGEDAELLSFSEILSIEEITRISRIFIHLGVSKLRITGGEPLVRKGIETLIENLGADVRTGRLAELTMTTNGIRLTSMASVLRAAGMKRVNVSLDAIDPLLFSKITRCGRVEDVMDGIAAAREAGLKVKINTVMLKDVNDGEIDRLIAWCGERGHDLTLIEAMPIGGYADMRADQHLPADEMRRRLASRWTLTRSTHVSGGPAQFYDIAETGGRLGFISALSHAFCGSCNRVRMTCTGSLITCLGQEGSHNLLPAIRNGMDDRFLEQKIRNAVADKPRGHCFAVGAATLASSRNQRNRMNRAGG